MPTPPLPSRDDDEHGAMPSDCRVETFAEWIVNRIDTDGVIATARAVRTLLEDVATRTARDVANGPFVTEREIPSIVSRVLGAP